MSMMQEALSLIASGLQEALGVAASYQRGLVAVNLTVIAQGSRDQEYAVRLGSVPESTDYVIFTPELGYAGFTVMVADLAAANLGTPQRGDKITIGGDVYPLLSPDGSGPWRWEDLPFKTMIRVHAKLSAGE